jgi:hypothetical protein
VLAPLSRLGWTERIRGEGFGFWTDASTAHDPMHRFDIYFWLSLVWLAVLLLAVSTAIVLLNEGT